MKIISSFLFIFLLCSCNSKPIWEKYVDLKNTEWDKDEVLIFDMPVDTNHHYDIYVDIRNTNEYPFSNIYLFISASINGYITEDTVSFDLAESSGQWLGKGGFSDYKEITYPYYKNINFPINGHCTLSVRHGMRVERLKGISAIGIRLENTEKIK